MTCHMYGYSCGRTKAFCPFLLVHSSGSGTTQVVYATWTSGVPNSSYQSKKGLIALTAWSAIALCHSYVCCFNCEQKRFVMRSTIAESVPDRKLACHWEQAYGECPPSCGSRGIVPQQCAPDGQGSKCCQLLQCIETSMEGIHCAISSLNLGDQGGLHCKTFVPCAAFVFQAVNFLVGHSCLCHHHHSTSLDHHHVH